MECSNLPSSWKKLLFWSFSQKFGLYSISGCRALHLWYARLSRNSIKLVHLFNPTVFYYPDLYTHHWDIDIVYQTHIHQCLQCNGIQAFHSLHCYWTGNHSACRLFNPLNQVKILLWSLLNVPNSSLLSFLMKSATIWPCLTA